MLWIMYDLGYPTDAIDAVRNLFDHATTQVILPSGVCINFNPRFNRVHYGNPDGGLPEVCLCGLCK